MLSCAVHGKHGIAVLDRRLDFLTVQAEDGSLDPLRQTQAHNDGIDRNIRIEGNIPAGLIRFLFLILAAAIIWAIHGIVSIDYLAAGQGILRFFTSLIPTALTIWFLWILIKSFFKK